MHAAADTEQQQAVSVSKNSPHISLFPTFGRRRCVNIVQNDQAISPLADFCPVHAQERSAGEVMGQDVSCPCHTDTKNVYFSDDEDNASADVTAIKMPGSPTSTAMNTASSAHSSNPFDSSNSNSSSRGPPVVKGKSKKWSALPKDGSDVNTLPGQSTQVRARPFVDEAGVAYFTRKCYQKAMRNTGCQL